MTLVIGCVERRITVISDPPHAKVILDGNAIGETPLETPFYFYGTREIVLHKNGYHVVAHLEEISPPLYQLFPLDFVSEFLVPFVIYDEHRLTYTLQPHTPLKSRQKKTLIDQANSLRREVTKEIVD